MLIPFVILESIANELPSYVKDPLFSIFGFQANYGTFSIKQDQFYLFKRFHVAFGHQIKKLLNATKSGSLAYDGSSSLIESVTSETNLTFGYWDGVTESWELKRQELALASWPRGERMVTSVPGNRHIAISWDPT